MKQCPRCNRVYADDNLNFCLADGASLSEAYDSEATVVLSPPFNDPSLGGSSDQTQQPSRQGVSPLFAYAAVGLLALLIGGGIVLWLKSDEKSSSAESQNTMASNTTSATSQNSNQVKEESKVNRNEITSNKNQTEKTIPQASSDSTASKLYRVVGVAYKDVLYIRPKPGQRDLYVDKIPANGVDIQILGNSVRVGNSVWVLVNYKGVTGWVNSNFLTEQ